MPETIAPYLKEFAPPAALPWGDPGGGFRLSGHIVRSEGFAGQRSAYALFEEMEDKDPHLFSVLQTRKLGLLARPVKIEPADKAAREMEIAQWVERALRAIPSFGAALAHLLDALAKGMSVLEILWDFDAEGRIVPRALKPRAAGRFALGRDGQWRLLPAEGDPGAGQPLPARKFVIARLGATDERPYGKGLCERVYWYWWFKKHNVKFWLIYNEKFGAPTVVARHRPGLSQSERERLLEVIDAIQTDAGVTVPEGIALELLEASRSGSGETYHALVRWCNDEISQAVLGQTLTAGEGTRSGSLALAQVHNEVRRDYMRADAALLMDTVNAQLVRPLVEMNFGIHIPTPRWTIDLAAELDLTAEIEVDRQLLQMGVHLPEAYFHEKYGRPAPTARSRPLQFDDSNLYQYHLQYGVLTINEVRAKLGLAPVPWGNRPTSPAGETIDMPTPRRPAGEADAHEDAQRKDPLNEERDIEKRKEK